MIVGSSTIAAVEPGFDRDLNARRGRFLGSFSGFPADGKGILAGDVTTYQPD